VTTIHQFVPSYTTRSWAGVHSGNVADLLHGMGIESKIFVGEARGVRRSDVHPFREFAHEPERADQWLLYQLSTGSLIADALTARSEPVIVNYHNVTPGSLWAAWEPFVVPEMAEGRHQMHRLAGRTVLGISDSSYNNAELLAAGYQRGEVCPILADYDDLGSHGDSATESRLRATKGGADWMFVGRVAPNKCQHQIVKAFAFYRKVYDPDARLWLAGGSASHAYLRAIENLVAALGLDDAVTILGSASQDIVTAHHRVADVVVCLSDHEGFCIPLVEAMWHGIPIVAYASSAVPETVGDAGLLLQDKSAAVVAAAVHRVVTDGALRMSLVEAGTKRLSELSLDRTRARFAELIEMAIGAGR
jgi:glycosyltransferase involved in cell wall biosynthesis